MAGHNTSPIWRSADCVQIEQLADNEDGRRGFTCIQGDLHRPTVMMLCCRTYHHYNNNNNNNNNPRTIFIVLSS